MEIQHVNGIAVVRAPASDDERRQLSDEWAKELFQTSEQLDPPVLVLDVSDVAQMHPRAMASLIQMHRRLRQRGGQLVLAGVCGPLADLIQITGFGREIHVAATCDDALAHVNASEAPSDPD